MWLLIQHVRFYMHNTSSLPQDNCLPLTPGRHNTNTDNTVNHSFDQPICWSTDLLINQSINKLINRSIRWLINELNNPSIDLLINLSFSWSINQSINQSIEWSIHQSNDWLINQSISWSTDWLINHSTERLIKWFINWQIDWLIDRPTNEPIRDWSPIYLLINQLEWLVHPCINQLTDRKSSQLSIIRLTDQSINGSSDPWIN